MLRPFAHSVACCCMLLRVFGNCSVAQSLKLIKRLAPGKRMQLVPTLLAQQCWDLLRSFAHTLSSLTLCPKRK